MFTIKTFNSEKHNASDEEGFSTLRHVFEAENYSILKDRDDKSAIVGFFAPGAGHAVHCHVGKDQVNYRIIVENSSGVNVEHLRVGRDGHIVG